MDASLTAAIRRELLVFVTRAGNSRALSTTCHVGHPGGEQAQLPHALVDEAWLRADLVERALDGVQVLDGACAWVTRGGRLDLTDADAEWFAAARSAFDRHGLVLPAFFVVNRSGWVDLVSGRSRVWSRIRQHSPAAG